MSEEELSVHFSTSLKTETRSSVLRWIILKVTTLGLYSSDESSSRQLALWLVP
jgi:hypothetical protein